MDLFSALFGPAVYIPPQEYFARPTRTADVDLLAREAFAVHDLENVLSGHAFSIQVLRANGLVEFDHRDGSYWHYRRTDAGRQQHLAAIGVREIHDA